MSFNQFAGYCVHGGPISNFCIESNCQSPATLCQNSQCGCHSYHKDCFSIINSSKILNSIIKKGNQFEVFQYKINLFFEKLMKEIQIERNNLFDWINANGIKYQNEQKDLFYFMKNNEQNKITSSLIIKILQNLKAGSKTDFNINLVKMFSDNICHPSINDATIRFKTQIAKLRSILEGSTDKVHFDPTLSDPSFSFSQDLKQVTKQIYGQRQLVIIDASSLKKSNGGFQLQIQNMSDFMKIGVCSSKVAKATHKNEITKKSNQIILLSNQGKLWDGNSWDSKFEKQQSKSTQFKFSKGDTIKISHQSRSLIFENISQKGPKTKVDLKSSMVRDDFYLCGQLWNIGDKIVIKD